MLYIVKYVGRDGKVCVEELSEVLTEIHVKLMSVCEDLVINHISDFFESGKVPEVVILRIIAQMFRLSCREWVPKEKEYFSYFSYEVL
jgi:hypothetical protein